MTYPEQPGQSAPAQNGQPPQYPTPPAPQGPPVPQAPAYGAPAAPPSPPQGYGAPAASQPGSYGPLQPDPAAAGATMPAYPATQGQYAAPVPGKGLAIAGLILAFLLPLIGFILSLVARAKLKKANAPTGIATAGIIIGAVFTVLAIIGMVVGGIAIANVVSMCGQLGPGTWQVGGVTYTCG